MIIDIKTGEAAGVTTVAVDGGSSPREELEALSPVVLLDETRQLSGILKNGCLVLDGKT